MKNLKPLFTLLIGSVISLAAFSQKYKSAADSTKLNKEYLEISNDIAELTAKLAVAQNNLPGYNNKASEANSNAQSTAAASSDQSSKAVGGDVGDAKKAKRKAKKALREAKDSENAADKVKDQEKKIEKLNSELQKKQDKLKDLDRMRNDIMNKQQ